MIQHVMTPDQKLVDQQADLGFEDVLSSI